MGEVRITLTDELHRALKLKAIEEDKTLKQLILDALQEVVKE